MCTSRSRHTRNALLNVAELPAQKKIRILSKFVEHLNSELSMVFRLDNTHPRKVVAANVTKAGSIVIHTAAPTVAAELQRQPSVVHSAAGSIPDFKHPDTPPILDLDVPWYGVVIHDIPAGSLLDAFEDKDEDIWDILERDAGVVLKEVKGDLKILCRKEEIQQQERLSMLVRFENQRNCDRLLRRGPRRQRVHSSRPTINSHTRPITRPGLGDLVNTTSGRAGCVRMYGPNAESFEAASEGE